MDQHNYRPRRPSANSNPRYQRPIMNNQKYYQRPQYNIQTTAAMGAHAFLPPFITATTPINCLPSPSTTNPYNPWRQSSATTISYRRHPYNLQRPQPPSQFRRSTMRSTSSFRMRTSTFSNVRNQSTPRFGPATNNKVFVDGRGYEVFYLNNVAVVEQNGLPYRIFFEGPPHDILIDGQTHNLAFGEVKMFPIDGIQHSIKFGSPFRELHIDDLPYRGTFDCTAFYANINGKQHEFRLSGPPPKVRIDPNPSYDLSSHLNVLRGHQQNQSIVKSEEDTDTWLQRIKQQGIRQIRPPSRGFKSYNPRATSSFPQKRFQRQNSFLNFNITPGISPPPPSMKEYEIGTFMVRYSEVVEALLRPRPTCPYCGIHFTDTATEAYQKHIDDHLQDLIKSKTCNNKSRSRKWFMDKDAWLAFDESAEVQKLPTTELQNDSTTTSSPHSLDAVSIPSLNKACSVCYEKFIEYYDNDEEEWRFQDCIVKENIAIHKYCVEQMNENDESIENNENVEIKQEKIP